MNWNAEDELAAWTFFKERLEIANTPKPDKVIHNLFYCGKEASERWTTLKDQLSEEDQKDVDEVFKAFANNFEKSSSHWQPRDEYLGDIKQGKQQTMAELNIYIKDMIRRCQFPHIEQESHKIEFLYHATT